MTAPSLHGRRVLITRAADQSGELAALLGARGARCEVVHLLRIEPLLGPAAIGRLLARFDDRLLSAGEMVAFTSANAVRLVLNAAGVIGRADAPFGRATVCAVGPATAAALRVHGIEPDLVPVIHRAEELAALITRAGVRGCRVWLPQAEAARDVLARELAAAGARVDAVSIYRAVLPEGAGHELASVLDGGPLDAVTLASGSAVRHLLRALDGRRWPAEAVAACIGPVTAEAALAAGWEVAATAAEPTARGLATALEEYFDRVAPPPVARDGVEPLP